MVSNKSFPMLMVLDFKLGIIVGWKCFNAWMINYDTATSKLIFSENQHTGFYTAGTTVVYKLLHCTKNEVFHWGILL